tara:strand:- start:1330 stop:1746 length:417 start_codon:yes stop_codon:yes gene_type:complete
MSNTLSYFNTRQTTAEAAITKLSAMLDTATVRELIVVVKSLELLEHYKNVTGYDALVEKLVTKAGTVMTGTLADDDMMYISRAISFGTGIPLGSELRWQIQNKDSFNLNINGDVVAGERSLEQFGDVILETFYAATAA